MLDPLDNPEIAAASKVGGGRFGQDGGILLLPTSSKLASTSTSSTPRAAHSRGVSVFVPSTPAPVIPAPGICRAHLHGRPHLPPPAPPGLQAGLRIVAT